MLYRIVLALEDGNGTMSAGGPDSGGARAWQEFVAESYGCMADDPIERGDQGWYEDRGPLT